MNEKPITYKSYCDSNYIVMSDGTMARVLKPIKIHNQNYFNPIINGKMKRVNKLDLIKLFDAPKQGDGLQA
jgi:hypothetical protein